MNKKIGKLALHRETVARLEDLSNVQGGQKTTITAVTVCTTCAVVSRQWISDCYCVTGGRESCYC